MAVFAEAEAKQVSPDHVAGNDRDKFVSFVRERLELAHKARAAVMEERQYKNETWERQLAAIGEVIEMCEGALERQRQPEPAPEVEALRGELNSLKADKRGEW